MKLNTLSDLQFALQPRSLAIEAFRTLRPAGITDEQIAAKLAAPDGPIVRENGRKSGAEAARIFFKNVAGKAPALLAVWLDACLKELRDTLATMKANGVSQEALALFHTAFVETVAAKLLVAWQPVLGMQKKASN